MIKTARSGTLLRYHLQIWCLVALPLYHKGGFLILFYRYLVVFLLFSIMCFSVVSEVPGWLCNPHNTRSTEALD